MSKRVEKRKRVQWVVKETPRGLWVVYPQGAMYASMTFRNREEADAYMAAPPEKGVPIDIPELKDLGERLARQGGA